VGAPPHLGVGIGYRAGLHAGLLRNQSRFDFLELVADSFFANPRAATALASHRPCVLHSLQASVGSRIELDYVERLRVLVEAVRPPWISDHLAYTRAGGFDAGHLLPVPWTDESLGVVAENLRAFRSLGVPIALENITHVFQWPHSTLSEADFLTELVRRAGCWILLDLENLRVNHANHGGATPEEFLDAIPLDRVLQVHLAGGVAHAGLEHDTHSAAIPERTWRLLEELCRRIRPPAVLIERDNDLPPVDELLREVARARAILEAA
jgi:hypothetical protein